MHVQVSIVHTFLFQIWDIRVGNGSIKSIKGPHICGEAIDTRVSFCLALFNFAKVSLVTQTQ